ncbi:AAA family ATPase [Kitasatospora sp. NPDC059599]|uniref:nucleotide-binding protein n=1 Tax=Kitasatospora sp. NPDC059599 TaxID=3346880 RepID=UPI0036BEBC18
MAGDHMVIERVRRLEQDADWDLAPGYGPVSPRPEAAPLPETAPLPEPALLPETAPLPEPALLPGTETRGHRPLDAMGTVLVPPEARPLPAALPLQAPPPPLPPQHLPPPSPHLPPPAVLLAVPPAPPVHPAPPAPPAPPVQAAPPALPVHPAPPVQAAPPALPAQAVNAPAIHAAPAARRGLRGIGRGTTLGRGERERLEAVIRTPLQRSYRIAVVGLKGGVGKTSATLALGSVLAETRSDKVIAVDANPDTGTLSQRVHRETAATVQDLLAVAPSITGYMDIRRFTSLTSSGLEVLANDPDPAVATGFGGEDYRQLVDLLARQYPIVLSDCGTSLLHGSMSAVLDLADQLVIAATTSVDGASGAGATLEWLHANGYGALAWRSVTLISGVRGTGRMVKAENLVAHFERLCRAAVVLPFDEHLALGGTFDPAKLRHRTRRAHLELAAAVAEGMSLDAAQPASLAHPAHPAGFAQPVGFGGGPVPTW